MNKLYQKGNSLFNQYHIILTMIIYGMYLAFTVFSSGYNPNPNTGLLLTLKSVFDIGRTVTYGLAAVLFGLNILYNKTFRWSGIILAFIMAVIYYFSRSKEMLIFCILGLDTAMIDFKYSLKTYQKVTITAIALVVLLSRFGIFTNALFDSDRLRVGLGFFWSNMCIFMTTIWITVMVWINSDRIKKQTIYFMAFILIILYSAQDARMVFLSGMILLIMTYLLKTNLRKNILTILNTNFMKWLFIFLPAILTITVFLMTLCYGLNPAGFKKLDMLMSDRLSYAWKGLETFGFTLFGQRIEWIGFSLDPSPLPYNFVDSSYLRITLNYGLFFLFLIIPAMCWTNYQVFQSGNMFHCIILAVMQLLFFNEAWLISLMYNPYIILTLREGMKLINKLIKNKAIKSSYN